MDRLFNCICVMLFVFCSVISSLLGEIIETSKIATIIPFINQKSIVFLNIDGTLHAPFLGLADYRWREYFISRVEEIVEDQEARKQLIDKMTDQIFKHLSKGNMEAIIPQLVDYWQKNEIVVLGITRSPSEYSEERIRDHLLNLNIDFSRTLNNLSINRIDQEENEFSFKKGVLFINEELIGSALLSFLNQSVQHPSHIIMVDQSYQTLESTQEALQSVGIAFTGVHYAPVNIEEFDPTLGIVEFFALINKGILLSDEEALHTIPTDKSIDYALMLDKYIEQAVPSQEIMAPHALSLIDILTEKLVFLIENKMNRNNY